jgi:hypothetical protein
MQPTAEGLKCIFVILFVGTLREAEPVGDSVKDRDMLSILAGEDSIWFLRKGKAIPLQA